MWIPRLAGLARMLGASTRSGWWAQLEEWPVALTVPLSFFLHKLKNWCILQGFADRSKANKKASDAWVS
jgi:hypothetical protein